RVARSGPVWQGQAGRRTLPSTPMLDVRALRTELDAIKLGLARRRIDTAELDRAAELDTRHRAALSEVEARRAEIKRLSADVGKARRDGDTATAERLAAESRKLGDDQAALDAQAATLAAELREVMLRIPNVPADDAPDGAGPDDNVVLRT